MGAAHTGRRLLGSLRTAGCLQRTARSRDCASRCPLLVRVASAAASGWLPGGFRVASAAAARPAASGGSGCRSGCRSERCEPFPPLLAHPRAAYEDTEATHRLRDTAEAALRVSHAPAAAAAKATRTAMSGGTPARFAPALVTAGRPRLLQPAVGPALSRPRRPRWLACRPPASWATGTCRWAGGGWPLAVDGEGVELGERAGALYDAGMGWPAD
jgi:hypothetical protein